MAAKEHSSGIFPGGGDAPFAAGGKFVADCSCAAMLEWRWNSSPDARWENRSTGLRVSGDADSRCAHAPSRDRSEIASGKIRTELRGHHAADERAPGRHRSGAVPVLF